MRNIWNEYGEMILGVMGAGIITGIVIHMFLPAGNIYEVITAFSRSIC